MIKNVVLVFALSLPMYMLEGAETTEIPQGGHLTELPPVNAWPTNGGDIYNRRFSPLSQINKTNLASLRGVWRTHLGGSGSG